MEYVAKMDSGPITEKQLVDAGFSATKLKEIGYGAEQLKLCGFDASELKEAEFTAIQLRCAGFTPTELRAGGYDVIDVHEAGFRHARLVEAGFSALDMKERLNLNLAELRAAGFKAGQLKSVGFLASELRVVGVTAAEIRPYFTQGGKCAYTHMYKVLQLYISHYQCNWWVVWFEHAGTDTLFCSFFFRLHCRDPQGRLLQGPAQASGSVAPRRPVAALQQLLVLLFQSRQGHHLLCGNTARSCC